jgi:hypothetical protein
MTTPNIAEAAVKIVEVLTPFGSEERHRAVHAALTLLGEQPTGAKGHDDGRADGDDRGLPRRAKAWLHQHGLKPEDLDQVFHRDGDRVEVIAAALPGHSTKERTLNAYLLTGVSQLIATGEPSFDDTAARNLCKNLGCYDDTNHATYVRDKGNRFAGSKDQGWKLTAPGLAQAAALVRQMTSGS